jgi:hypothetical protein
VGHDADVARPGGNLRGQLRDVGGGVRAGEGDRRLEPGQVPRLGRRLQRERVGGARHAQVGHELGTGGDDRCVDLVRDHAHAVLVVSRATWPGWADEPWPRVVGVQSAEASVPGKTTSGDNEFGGGAALSALISYARSNYP